MAMKRPLDAIPPGPLFVLGLLTLPAFLFQDGLLYRFLETVLFLLLVLFSGKKVRPLPGLLLLASVTAASLLVPYGRVVITMFGLPVTAGALEAGLSRGLLLLGLLYLSKFSVRAGLVFPGRIGDGIGKVFFYFERFSESREKVSINDLPGSLDNLLIAVSGSGAAGTATETPESARGLLAVPLAAAAVCWVLLFL